MPASRITRCGACNESITKSQGSILCNICSHWLHASCAKISEKDLLALKSIKSSAFICALCEPNLNNSHSCDSGGIAATIVELNSKFDNFILNNRAELGSIKSALDAMKTEFVTCLNGVKSDIAGCNHRISDVESFTTSKIAALESENNVLHRRLNRADFIIGGLPGGLQNLVDTVVALFAFYKIDFTGRDVNYVCYINNKKQILVRLNSVHIRDSVMKEYFRTRALRVCDILGEAYSDVENRVYLNDHYSPAAGYLNSICKKLRQRNRVTKFKILNGDNLRAKLMLPDGRDVIRDVNGCVSLLNDADGALN